VSTFLNDLKYAIRQLCKHPGFTATVVLVLAVGIGANTTVFTVVNMMLNSSSFSHGDSDRLVDIIEKNRPWGIDERLLSPETFPQWQQQCQSFEAMACSQHIVAKIQIAGRSHRVTVSRWSPDILKVLKIQPHLGRAFSADEDQPELNHVALLTSAFWKKHLGADPDVLGQIISLDQESYRIVGVLPPKLGIYDITGAIWVPLPRPVTASENQFLPISGFLARLKTGVSMEQADAELQGMARIRVRSHDHAAQDWSVMAQPIDHQSKGMAKYAFLFQMPVIFVLLIACSNAASMILAKGSARQREMSIRLALGASRVRIMCQLSTESLLYALLAGSFGIALAHIGVLMLHAWLPPGATSLVSRFVVDARVLWFTVGISTGTGLLCGLFPALQLSKQDLNSSLKVTAPSPLAGRHRSRFLNGLVVAEMAFSVILLVGTGLMIRSLLYMQQIDMGFNAHHLLSGSIDLPEEVYATKESQHQAMQAIIDQCRALPGIEGVTLSEGRPWERSSVVNIRLLDDHRTLSESAQEKPQGHLVNAQYFSTLGIAMRAGREFSYSDEQPEARTIVINERLAQQLWPDQNPVGQYIDIQDQGLGVHQVVGVVANVLELETRPEIRPCLYLPILRSPTQRLSLILKTSGDPALSIPAVREALIQLHPDLKPQRMGVLKDVIGDSMASDLQKAMLIFIGILSIVALILAATGIYGVMAYLTSQRTQEIGIRLALGADTQDILRLALKNGLRIIVLGLVIGCVLALGVAQVLGALLYEVNPSDPVTFTGVALLLALVGLWACYIPARRATKVDPMEALRYE